MNAQHPIFLIVDLFCGFGGTTTGFADAEINGNKIAKVIACVNHDPKAIKSHWLNHPEVKHFEEDIRTLDLTELAMHVKNEQDKYPAAKLILWASLECTNFSKAKGGQPRDADSRTLADHLFRYKHVINPDYIQIENVVEFMSWGPLISKVSKTDEGFSCCQISYTAIYDYDDCCDDDVPDWDRINGLAVDLNRIKKGQNVIGCKVTWQGIPESKKNGQDYMRWCNEMCSFGYHMDWRELNSADFGAYTSRNRLFGCFAKHGLPIVWPHPTHSKKTGIGGMFSNLKKWMPVKDVLNFADEGKSIFTRKKPLSDKTLERIYAGLVKYVAKGDTSFISKYYSGRPAGKVIPVDGPAGTITTAANQTLVSAAFIAQRNTGDPESKLVDIDGPARTLTSTGGNQDLVQAQFILKYNSTDRNGKHTPPSVNEPAPVVAAQSRLGLIQGQFLQHYYGNGFVTGTDEPCPTLTTKERVGLVDPQYFVDKHYGTFAQNQSINDPAGTVMPNDKHRLVEAVPFVMPTNYDNTPKSIEEPAPTIQASRRHHYLVNPSHGGHCTSTDAPCPVIIARQDKAPLYVVMVENGPVGLEVYADDTAAMIKIKQFMAVFGLVDIKMRMLRVVELLRIQGFPEQYQMVGNQSDHKKFIGNSVHPLVPKAWAEAMGLKLMELKKAA